MTKEIGNSAMKKGIGLEIGPSDVGEAVFRVNVMWSKY